MRFKTYTIFEAEFPSQFGIGDVVLWGNPDSMQTGTITSVKFTKAKVFYDIVDDYSGELITHIDSAMVSPLVEKSVKEDFAAVGVAPAGNVGGMGPVIAPTSNAEGSGDAWPTLGTPSTGTSFPKRKKKKKKKMKHVKMFESFLNEEWAMFKAKDFDKTLITYAIDAKADEIYVIKVDKVKNSTFPELSKLTIDKRFRAMWGMMLEEEWLKEYGKMPKVGDILPEPKRR